MVIGFALQTLCPYVFGNYILGGVVAAWLTFNFAASLVGLAIEVAGLKVDNMRVSMKR